MDTTHLDHPHPKEKLYVKVALWLGLVTAIEIMLSYLGLADWLTVVLLVILAMIKFWVVAGYFMHLKFDNPALRKPFVGGFVLAIVIYTIVLLAFTLHSSHPAG